MAGGFTIVLFIIIITVVIECMSLFVLLSLSDALSGDCRTLLVLFDFSTAPLRAEIADLGRIGGGRRAAASLFLELPDLMFHGPHGWGSAVSFDGLSEDRQSEVCVETKKQDGRTNTIMRQVRATKIAG